MKQEVKQWIKVHIPRGANKVIQVYEPPRRRVTLIAVRKANRK